MVAKKDFQRVEDYVYEIPKNFRSDMRVPARLYADDVILEDALRDRSVEQLINTATLPGVVKYTLAMPDIHQGYGPPIGGVIALDASTGVISPGATGYDINCLAGDTLILHRDGYHRPIAQMERDWAEAQLRCQNLNGEGEDSTDVIRFLKLRPQNTVYLITTEAGDEITVTADHPFWTPDGMVEAGYLKPGDQVAIYPFVGVPYEEPSSEVIVTEEDVKELLLRLGKDSRGRGLEQIIGHLKKRGLLPLRYNSSQLPYLLRMMGYLFGDGTVYFVGGRGEGKVAFYGKPEDLKAIQKDAQRLGFTSSYVYRRRRQHAVATTYGDYAFEHDEASFTVSSSALAALFAALGVPLGNKAAQDYDVPAWLRKAPLWQKRLFLAAHFGAELTSPQAFTERNYNFYTPVLSLNKRQGHVESGRAFLHSLADLLAEFGVQVKSISQRREQVNPDGTSSHRLRLIISSTPESLSNLWGKIGFEYNRERQALASVATQYLKHKSQVVALREEVAEMALAQHQAGQPPQDIYAGLTGPHVNRRFLERSIYGGRKMSVRVGSAFLTFDQYAAQVTQGLGSSGMVWERVARIEPVDFDDFVYDFTVAHPDHNFIANGFVVSNCGVRLLRSEVLADEIEPFMDEIVNALFHGVPSGVGRGGDIRLSGRQMDEVLEQGAQWVVRQGYGTQDDLEHTEAGGCMAGARASAVSTEAKKRGNDQVGTLGSGNHFIEVARVAEIYDEEAAKAFGLFEGQMAVWIHSGSRGLGHQVCTDYVKSLQKAVRDYGIQLPDRELVCAPFTSPEGQSYFAAMACAANYAWANRQALTHRVRQVMDQVLAGKVKKRELRLIYDVAHNIVKREEYVIEGKPTQVIVHRKGATRAFGPGHPEVPAAYRDVGQPVLVPGDMGTASYVLVGTQEAMDKTFSSSCHGAGRVLSRAAAIKQVRGQELQERLRRQGIIVRGGDWKGLAEEAPEAYKDVERVVEVVHRAGIARKVARLVPMGVIKG